MRHLLGWDAFELHCQEMLGLSGTAASGSQWHDPGDGVDQRHYTETDYALMIDAKYTKQRSFSVNLAFMRTWLNRAGEAGKRFALPIRFEDWRGQTEDFIVVPLNDYVELIEKAGVKNGR